MLAADGAATWQRGPADDATKIYPVGKLGAFLIRGQSAFRHGSGAAAQELDLLEVALPLVGQGDGTLASINTALSQRVGEAISEFLSKTHSKIELNVHFIFIGYEAGVPALYMSHILGAADQANSPNARISKSMLPTSFTLPLGADDVAKGILDGSREALTPAEEDSPQTPVEPHENKQFADAQTVQGLLGGYGT